MQKKLLLDWDQLYTTEAARAEGQAFADTYRTDEPRRLMLDFAHRTQL